MIDLGKERELRELRGKVSALTDKLAVYEKRLIAPVTSVERYEEEHRKCSFHLRVFVSMETASVTCQECGAELSPLDVLREFANGERRFVEHINHLREERSKLAIEVEQLKTQRSSLRSQIRKKGGTVPDDPNATRPSASAYYALWRQCETYKARLKKAGLLDDQGNARDVGEDDGAAAGGGRAEGSHPS